MTKVTQSNAEGVQAATDPPKRTGMRGSHEGAFEAAHDLRDGKTWEQVEDDDEVYDLIVVGGGLSGLAAAYYFRKNLPAAKVLILECHDDFGGHATRNEFVAEGSTRIGLGGNHCLTGAYPPAAIALLEDIGLDVQRFHETTASTRDVYPQMGLGNAVFFDRETFGEDRLVVGEPHIDSPVGAWREFLAKAPLSQAARDHIVRLYDDKRDYLAGLSADEKIQRLRKMSYQDYLLEVVGVSPDVIPYFLRRALGTVSGAAGIDSYSAWGAFRSGVLPGLEGLGLKRPHRNWLGDAPNPLEGIHFPDGNAGIARLLTRWLIPGALPGKTMEDSVTTPVVYAALDQPDSPVRLRLDSTVIGVAHRGASPREADEIEVTYVTRGAAHRVRGGSCVLACYNSMIPYLCPALPAEQKEALAMAVRRPRVCTNVFVRNWRAFRELGVYKIHCPGSFHQGVELHWDTSIGEHQLTRSPEQAIIVRLNRDPIAPGLPAREQFRAGAEELLDTPLEVFERRTREQLGRMLGPGGFDGDADILAITVNRWPHGYATGANDLYDPDWSYEEAPWVKGRKRFGRITIANSDAAAVCLAQAAFGQAHRAVRELLDDVIRPEFQHPWTERV